MNRRKKIILLTIGFFVAIVLVLYPLVASVYNAYVEKQTIVEYEENISEIDEEEYAELIEAAIAWNEELYGYIEPSYFPEGMTNNEIYESLLNVNGDGMIGYIVIPSINVNLPIYHYTTDDVLLKGAGHMEASALPVGGENTHCVITAHRGLPSATMFTNLDQVEIGDIFYTKVLNETFYYEVISITEVAPDETSSLLPVEGEDLCTLVTCTPYGINTKRLLVTGKRIEVDEEEIEDISDDIITTAIKTNWILLIVAILEFALYIFIIIFIKKKKA